MARLVGRDAVTALLRRAWSDAGTSSGRPVLLAGEPGIGKTALAADLTDHVAAGGGNAVWGACADGSGVPAFWPWPDVVARLGVALPRTSDREAAWFDCATTVVEALRRSAPVLVVLDDLQWAGAGAVRVLEFAVRQLVRERVLLVGTYRDTEVEDGHPLLGVLGSAEVITLGGLGADDVARMLDGVPQSSPTVAEVHRRTGGNPFFVQQIARLLDTGESAAHRVPVAVGEALARRYARLPQPTVELLDLAAVGGSEVDAAVLARAAGRPYAEVAAELAPAVRARILRADDSLGGYRFEHDLYREARLDALDRRRLAEAHLAYARALQADPAIRPGAVAYHYARAVPAADAGLARQHVESAADTAMAEHSYEEAARLRHDAVRLAELDGPVPPEALLGLGDALLAAGEPDRARRAYQRAVDRSADDIAVRARGAIGLHRSGVASGQPRAALIAMLASVEGRIGGIPGARVRAALARELADGPDADLDRARSLASSAVDDAAETGDPGTEAVCLFAQHDVEWAPGSAARRLDLIVRMVDAADRAGDTATAGEGEQLRFAALTEVGDPAARSALDTLVARSNREHQPRLSYLAASRQAAYELLTGSVAHAHRLALAARELGEAIGEPDTWAVYATQTVAIELIRGGPAGMGAALRAAGADLMPPEMLPHQRMFELLAAGQATAAAALLRATAASGEESMYRWRAVARAALEIEVAVAAGAPDVCPPLYRYLSAYAGQLVLIGGAVAILPPVDLYLGLAAAADGRTDAAAGHFRDAVEIGDRMGAAGYAARARVELAAVEGSTAALADAVAVAVRLGHDALAERAAALAAPADAPAAFVRHGEIWTLTYDGLTVQVPDAKGLHDLARLLRVPGQEISAQELAGDPTPDTGADDILDATAKAAYKNRLAELDAEIDEADAAHDDGRRARAADEREALVSALAQAYGLGGRSRRLKDPGERARTAVTARIRDSLRRIDAVHPALGEHLRGSVQTGRRCVYRPASPVRWTV